MAPPRKFDHDEARTRHAAGATIAELAAAFGVHPNAVRRAVDAEVRARDTASTARWTRSARCPDCGAQTTRHRVGGDHRCRSCAAVAAATSVRASELFCARCREWTPDEAFPHNRAGARVRRGRHEMCRACLTVARREYREARKVPCSHGCGRLVLHERRDPAKPPECRPCSLARIHAERKAAAA